MPPSPRLPSAQEARIIACLDGRSLTGAQVASEAPAGRDGIYSFLSRMVDVGFLTRVGLMYRATVLGRAALKRRLAIDALRSEPLEHDGEQICGHCRKVGALNCVCDTRAGDDA